jgi:hypothetical protein
MKKKLVALLTTAMIMLLPVTAFAAGENKEKIADLEARVATLEQRMADLESIIAGLTGSEPVTSEAVTPESAAVEAPTTEAASDLPEDAIVIDFEGTTFTYDGYQVSTSSEGNPRVILYGYFTNNTDEPSAALFNYIFTVYQNGRELTSAIVFDDSAVTDRSTKILPGSDPIYVGYPFMLQDASSELTVELKPLMDWSGDSKVTFNIQLK